MLNMNVKWQVMYMPAELHARPVSSHARCLKYCFCIKHMLPKLFGTLLALLLFI